MSSGQAPIARELILMRQKPRVLWTLGKDREALTWNSRSLWTDPQPENTLQEPQEKQYIFIAVLLLAQILGLRWSSWCVFQEDLLKAWPVSRRVRDGSGKQQGAHKANTVPEPHTRLGADGAGGCCSERSDGRQALLPTALSFPVQKIMR